MSDYGTQPPPSTGSTSVPSPTVGLIPPAHESSMPVTGADGVAMLVILGCAAIAVGIRALVRSRSTRT